MEGLRVWIKQARDIVLEQSAAEAVSFLSLRYKEFGETYREIENALATEPTEIGIRGVASDDVEVGYYYHVSDRVPPINLLYRYNERAVYIESVAIERQAIMRAS